jgi:hypothetical protein
MKTINRNIVFILLLIINLYPIMGCIDENSNTESSKIQVPLNSVTLLEEEFFYDKDKLYESIKNESYTMDNLTGNNKTWKILEAYFATFASNTSRIMESVIRFESKQVARDNINLYKQFLLTNKQFIEQSMELIGDESFLLYTTMVIKENVTDVYVLVFSIRDVVVSLQAAGVTKNETILYATTIENILTNEE